MSKSSTSSPHSHTGVGATPGQLRQLAGDLVRLEHDSLGPLRNAALPLSLFIRSAVVASQAVLSMAALLEEYTSLPSAIPPGLRGRSV